MGIVWRGSVGRLGKIVDDYNSICCHALHIITLHAVKRDQSALKSFQDVGSPVRGNREIFSLG